MEKSKRIFYEDFEIPKPTIPQRVALDMSKSIMNNGQVFVRMESKPANNYNLSVNIVPSFEIYPDYLDNLVSKWAKKEITIEEIMDLIIKEI